MSCSDAVILHVRVGHILYLHQDSSEMSLEQPCGEEAWTQHRGAWHMVWLGSVLVLNF